MIPAHLSSRKQLADFAKRAGTTPEIARKVTVVRRQLCLQRRGRITADGARWIAKHLDELDRLAAQIN